MGTDRLNEQPDLLSTPNKSCPYVSNDHPPNCMQPPQTSCLKCPEYLDGLCDLIPWGKETMTEDQRILLQLYKKREDNYDVIGKYHRRNWNLEDAIQETLKRIRGAEGR